MELRQQKHLNNIVEQDHRFIKKWVWLMLGFHSFKTATKTLAGIEAMHMIKKGQTLPAGKSVHNQIQKINHLVGLAVSDWIPLGICRPLFISHYLCNRTYN